MDLNKLQRAAFDYINAGRSVIPTTLKDKRPVVKEWKPYQESAPMLEQAIFWFEKHKALAIITGQVSGNIELIDFDFDEARPNVFSDWRKFVEEEDPDLFKKLTIQTTQNDGFHVLYSCPEIQIPGNTKLAQFKNGTGELKTLVETRGRHGYFLADPSPGYQLKQGNFVDVSEITPAQREILLRSARLLNEHAMPAKKPPRSSSGEKRDRLSPGDDFNDRGDIRAYLESKGWTYAGSQGDIERWRRPGKERGNSASLLDGTILYNFSSNAHPLIGEQSYDLFGLYVAYEHNGDFAAAAKALAKKDYGERPTPKPPDDLSNHPAWAGEESAAGQRPARKCQLFSLESIKDCFQQDVRFIWREHIPADMPTMFSGREGDGKTTNCIQIAKEMLEENPSDYVVWIASEGFIQDTISKMLQLHLDDKRILFLQNDNQTFSFNFNQSYDRKQLDRQLTHYRDEGKKIIAVFVDSIRGITPFDDNDSRVKNVLLGLNAIVCDKFKAALIYIDHHKKGEARSALDKVVGTTAKAAAVRCVYAVSPLSGMVRKIELAKTNILDHQPAPLRSVFSNRHGVIIYEAESADLTAKDEAQRWLIELFTKQSSYMASEIFELGEEHGFNSGTLKKAKEELGIESKQEAFGKPWLWVTDRFLEK
jgi:archaellum biogenesis ATPase FlaH